MVEVSRAFRSVRMASLRPEVRPVEDVADFFKGGAGLAASSTPRSDRSTSRPGNRFLVRCSVSATQDDAIASRSLMPEGADGAVPA